METHLLTREDKKYSDLWQNGYCDANWKRLAEVVVERASPNQRNIIDFGFGSANSMQFFRDNSFYAEGVDVSSYAVQQAGNRGFRVYKASLDDMSILRSGLFAYGFCNDVIEHLPEECVLKALEEMARICFSKLFLSVCPTPSHGLSLDGENLHLTVRPEGWWAEQISRIGSWQRIPFRFSRSLRYVVDLKKQGYQLPKMPKKD